jgi:hypothetical protein
MTAIDKLKSLANRRAADHSSVAAPIAASPVEDDLPTPSNINTVFLAGLFLLAMLTACYLAAEIIPVLWGTVAFLLNYVPILGPMSGVVVFLLAGPSARYGWHFCRPDYTCSFVSSKARR